MNLFRKMEEIAPTFSNAESKYYEFLLNNIDYVIRNDAKTIATQHGFSQASITRFAKRVGFNGYSEFLYELQRATATTTKEEETELSFSEEYKIMFDKMETVFSKEILQQITKTLYKSDRIFISGFHTSAIPAQSFTMQLDLFRYSAQFLSFDQIFKLNAFARKNDTVVIFSTTNNTYQDLFQSLNQMGDEKPTIIVFTFSKIKKLMKNIDYVYVLPNNDDINAKHFLEYNILYLYLNSRINALLKAK